MDTDMLFLGFRWGLMLTLTAGASSWLIYVCIRTFKVIGG